MTRTDIDLFGKKIMKYAYFRTIFFGLALLTLIISFNLLPKLEGVDIGSMNEAEFSAFVGPDILLYIALLIFMLGLAILGAVVLFMYVKYVIQLKHVSEGTSSVFLRNIFVCELLRPVVWIIQLTLLTKMDQGGFQLLNIVSGGISIIAIIQFIKWIDTFQDYQISVSIITILRSFLTIWIICIFAFSLVSVFQGFGIFLQIIGEFNGQFMVIIESVLLLVISLVLWLFGKKLVTLF